MRGQLWQGVLLPQNSSDTDDALVTAQTRFMVRMTTSLANNRDWLKRNCHSLWC